MATKNLLTTSTKSNLQPPKTKMANKKRKHQLKSTSSAKRQEMPLSQRVWRKTIVRTKPKPKIVVPRLFRIDQLTGLPFDYERTVSRIMHYVNPLTSQCLCPEQLKESMLTSTLASFLENCNCNRCPQYINQQIYSILKSHRLNTAKMDPHNDFEVLSQFHGAGKRRPVMSEPRALTNESKLNSKNLTKYSKHSQAYC